MISTLKYITLQHTFLKNQFDKLGHHHINLISYDTVVNNSLFLDLNFYSSYAISPIDVTYFSIFAWYSFMIFDRSTCSKRSKESLFSWKKKTLSSIYSILVYFTMFSFRVLTFLKNVSIHIILNLNKFRHVWESYEL